MLTLLGKLMGKKSRESCEGEEKEVKCQCGEEAVRVPNDISDVYLCKKCNKLLYYVDPSPGLLKVRPLSLAWLKRK